MQTDASMRIRIVEADGVTPSRAAAPAALPTDMVPGEIVQWPSTTGGLDIFMLIDKVRSWDNSRWQLYATLSTVTPADVDDAAIAQTRQRLLRAKGWLG